MNKVWLRIILLFFLMLPAISMLFSQTDTTWLSKNWQPSQRDSASYCRIQKHEDSLWHQLIFFSSTNTLHMDGWFTVDSPSKRINTFKWFTKDGKLSDSIMYRNGYPWREIHYYPSGKMKRREAYNIYGESTDAMSWFENGQEKFSDTLYYDKEGFSCAVDTADRSGIIRFENGLWHLQIFSMQVPGSLRMDGWYKEKYCKTNMGIKTTYYPSGAIKDTSFYNNGKEEWLHQYYENGKLKKVGFWDKAHHYYLVHHWEINGNRIMADTFYMGKDCCAISNKNAMICIVETFTSDTCFTLSYYNVTDQYNTGKKIFRVQNDSVYITSSTTYKQGIIQDSVVFKLNKRSEDFSFYDNGMLHNKIVLDDNEKLKSIFQWDSLGNPISPDSSKTLKIQPPGGNKAFNQFLNKKISEGTTAAIRKNASGIVWITFEIDENGKVNHPFISTASGYKEIDDCILKAFTNSTGWKFLFHDVAINSWINWYVVFRNGKI